MTDLKGYYRTCSFPKDAGRKDEKAAVDRSAKNTRALLRTRIFALDHGKCRRCGKRLWLKLRDAPSELLVGHVHEWLKRSLGGNPLDPFNCLLLCPECHDLVDDNKVELVAVDSTRLMRGPVEFNGETTQPPPERLSAPEHRAVPVSFHGGQRAGKRRRGQDGDDRP